MTTEPLPGPPVDPLSMAVRRARELAHRYFVDVPVCANARIRLGRRARYRLGSVRPEGAGSVITLNPLLLDPSVPGHVLDGTILHEMAHLAHGFGTEATRSVSHPHRGGVVIAELRQRGCDQIASSADEWVKANWSRLFLTAARDVAARRRVREETAGQAWRRFLVQPGMRTEAELARLCAELTAASGGRRAPDVGWLHATLRQTRMLYVCSVPPRLRVHGLLAHSSVPDSVLAEQIATWLAGRSGGRAATNALVMAVLGADAPSEAAHWRSRHWAPLRRRLHPLGDSRKASRSG